MSRSLNVSPELAAQIARTVVEVERRDRAISAEAVALYPTVPAGDYAEVRVVLEIVWDLVANPVELAESIFVKAAAVRTDPVSLAIAHREVFERSDIPVISPKDGILPGFVPIDQVPKCPVCGWVHSDCTTCAEAGAQAHEATIPEKALPTPDGSEESEAALDRIMANLQVYGEHDGHAWYIGDKGAAAWAVQKIATLEASQAENQRIADAQRAPHKRAIEKIEAWLAQENGALGYEITFFTAHLERFHRSLFEAATDKEKAKLKTIKLPAGNLQLRAQQPDVTYDDGKVVSWVKSLFRAAPVDPEAARATIHGMIDQVVDELAGAADKISPSDLLDIVATQLRKNWMGDSLEGSLALVRVTEEPVKAELKKRIEFKPASEVPDGQLVAIDQETGEHIPGITAVERPAAFTVKLNTGGM